MMTTRSLPTLLLFASLVTLGGCEQRSALVYVLESPQSMTLAASASATRVEQGGTVVLHLERRTAGAWKQIPRDEVRPGQCWLYQRPPEREAEVADNALWEVVPEDAVRFNTEYRMDHTRIATMIVKGRIRLTPISAVRCEEERAVEGSSLEIEVF